MLPCAVLYNFVCFDAIFGVGDEYRFFRKVLGVVDTKIHVVPNVRQPLVAFSAVGVDDTLSAKPCL